MYYYEIDGYQANIILVHTQYFSLEELQEQYKKALRHANGDRKFLSNAMKRLYGYELLKLDYVIDTDIDRIYRPKY